jgi:phosphomannomutase
MPLIASISGIRGVFGDGLDPEVLVRYASAYAVWCRDQTQGRPLVVVGRDARVTGPICSQIVTATLKSAGCDVIDAGLATTPTVEMAVLKEKATGGIIFSASHNPAEWNALKLLNGRGEFLTPAEGETVMRLAEDSLQVTVPFDAVGTERSATYLDYHIDQILALPFLDLAQIQQKRFKVAVDAVNSVGGVAVPALLNSLGIPDSDITLLNCEPTGLFSHNPEPLPGNLTELMSVVKDVGADIGIAVDPDVDRLALVQNDGRFFGEELTQVLAAEFMWARKSGPFVTNLSSSRAVEDVASKYGQTVHRSAVGEINVVEKMKEVDAILGGEGNGGVIVPDLHYGRDALVGIAITLQLLADRDTTLSEVRSQLPTYVMAKNKVSVDGLDPEVVLAEIQEESQSLRMTAGDGVKIDFDEGWVHMRKSNTEPIIRVYSEAATVEKAKQLADRYVERIAMSSKSLNAIQDSGR